jgi:hypothetical protein
MHNQPDSYALNRAILGAAQPFMVNHDEPQLKQEYDQNNSGQNNYDDLFLSLFCP